MGVLEGALIGAEAAEKSTLDKAGEVLNGPVLDYLSGPGFDYTILAGGIVYALSAGASLPQIAVPFAVGAIAGEIGHKVGGSLGHRIAQWQGKNRVATEGEAPARFEDHIAHQNKNAGLWGVLAGVIVGAAAAVFVVCTFGVGLVAIGAAAIGVSGPVGFAIALGVGVGTGFVLGEAINAIADGVGNAVDNVLDFLGLKGPPDGQIKSGSLNVNTKDKPAARAAGRVPSAVIYALLEQEATHLE